MPEDTGFSAEAAGLLLFYGKLWGRLLYGTETVQRLFSGTAAREQPSQCTTA
jgi:hypothetical protein